MKTVLAINGVVWLYGAAAALQPSTIGEWIILAAGVVAALGVLRAKVLAPAWAFGRKFGRGVDAMLESPHRFEAIENRLERGHARMERIERALHIERDAA